MKVLITGASSGMGLDMAKYLSKLGYDLLVLCQIVGGTKNLDKEI